MYVNENNTFRRDCIKLKICSMDGECITVEIGLDVKVDSLKTDVIAQLFESQECSKLSLYYHLLHVRCGRVVDETLTLRQAEIVDSGEHD